MYCVKCGNEVNDNAMFCNKCGAKIEIKQENSDVNKNISIDYYSQYSADELFEKLDSIKNHYEIVDYDSQEFAQNAMRKVVDKVTLQFVESYMVCSTILQKDKYPYESKLNTIEYLLKESISYFQDAKKISENTDSIQRFVEKYHDGVVSTGFESHQSFSVKCKDIIDMPYTWFAFNTAEFGTRMLEQVANMANDNKGLYDEIVSKYRPLAMESYMDYWRSATDRLKIYNCYVTNDEALSIKQTLTDMNRILLGSSNDSTLNRLCDEASSYCTESEQQAQGCYIATCVYGSYDCPAVWTLRRFRDYKLAKTHIGMLFIKAYYFVSPWLVEKFGERKWFKKFFKSKLDIFVEKLNNDGFENTPYKDMPW